MEREVKIIYELAQWITRGSQTVRTREREPIPYRSFSSCGWCRWCFEWVMLLRMRQCSLLRYNQIKLIKFFSFFLPRRILQTTIARAAFMAWVVRIYQNAWKKIAPKIWEISSRCKSERNCHLREKLPCGEVFVSWEMFSRGKTERAQPQAMSPSSGDSATRAISFGSLLHVHRTQLIISVVSNRKNLIQISAPKRLDSKAERERKRNHKTDLGNKRGYE